MIADMDVIYDGDLSIGTLFVWTHRERALTYILITGVEETFDDGSWYTYIVSDNIGSWDEDMDELALRRWLGQYCTRIA